MALFNNWLVLMSFSARLVSLRKQKGLTQQGLSDTAGIHVQQIKRYEAGTSQPTAEALKRLALALHVSSDALLFEENERGPEERLKLQFEALSKLDSRERDAVETVIAGVLHMHDAKRWTQPSAPSTKPAVKKKGHGTPRTGTRG